MATSSVSQLPVWSKTAIESCLHGQQVVCVVGKSSAMASHWQHQQWQLVVSASCLCGPKLQLRVACMVSRLCVWLASHQQWQVICNISNSKSSATATSSVSQLPVWSKTAIESCLHGQQVVCVVGKPSAMVSHQQQQVIGNIGNSKSSAMAGHQQQQ